MSTFLSQPQAGNRSHGRLSWSTIPHPPSVKDHRIGKRSEGEKKERKRERQREKAGEEGGREGGKEGGKENKKETKGTWVTFSPLISVYKAQNEHSVSLLIWRHQGIFIIPWHTGMKNHCNAWNYKCSIGCIQWHQHHFNQFNRKSRHLLCVHCKSLQSCPTLCHPLDCSPPDSSVHGILQTRILEWVIMSSSRGFTGPRDQTHATYAFLHGQ